MHKRQIFSAQCSIARQLIRINAPTRLSIIGPTISNTSIDLKSPEQKKRRVAIEYRMTSLTMF